MSNQSDMARGMAVYRRLLGYLKPYLKVFVIGVIGMIIGGAADAGFAYLMKPLLDSSFVDRDPFFIKWLPPIIVLIFVVKGVSSFTAQYCTAWVGRKIVTALRGEMFQHMLELPTAYYDNASSGELLSKLAYNTEQVAGAATRAVNVLISDSVRVLLAVALMFYLSPLLSLGILFIAPPVGLLMAVITRRLRNVSTGIQDSMGQITRVAEETIEGNRVVKIFGGQVYEDKRYKRANEQTRQLNMKLVVTDALNVPFVQLITAIVMAFVIYIVTSDILKVSLGTFTAYVAAMMVLLPAVKRLTAINVTLQRGIAAGQSLFDFLAIDSEPDLGKDTLHDIKGDVSYQHVSFAYSAEKGDVLNDVTVNVDAGKMVAFVGHSGSGKSTLVNLLPRFYEIERGAIHIDGVDTKTVTLTSLREQIAYVGQDITLFNDTIARNIAYGRLEDTDQESVINAAANAHATEFIEKLPDGFDTFVGEDGIMLSGGQRQRVAIARALLKDAPILILDEATSALDTESERQIQVALETLMKGRTTLVIAHRLSTVEKADRIFVMDNGEIVEQGTHSELLAMSGRYAALYQMQFRDN